MAKIRWLPEAIGDVERLYKFLQDKDLKAATKAASCILAGTDRLKKAPQLGVLMDKNAPSRELYVTFGAAAYVIRYRFEDDKVIIIRVWHSREDRH